jgi:hypothetical protein
VVNIDRHRRWSVGDTLEDPALRIPLTYFVVAELLDILSTVMGLVLGLDELNPVTAGVLHRFGAWGLLLQKIPVIIALTMAVSWMPRRTAWLAAWACTVLMAGVVASNVGLLLAAHS